MTYIRPWRMDDAEDLAKALSNRNIQENLRDGLPYPYTPADAGDYITSMAAAPPETAYTWAISIEGVAVGSIGVFRKENIHRQTGELGYYLAQEHWGKGIMTKAVQEVCSDLFQRTDLLRIFAEPFAYNKGSCRVLEKAGFTFEGVLRQNAVKNGTIIDMKLYSILKQEWQEKRL